MSFVEKVLWAATSLPVVLFLVLAVALTSACAAVGNWDSSEIPERHEDPPCGELGECGQ